MTQFGDLLGPQPVYLPEHPETDDALAAGEPASQVAADDPTASAAWAALAEGELTLATAESSADTTDETSPHTTAHVIAAYAHARTGYHRGLDALRAHGWKGFGPVPFGHEPNQGFLRCVAALSRAAGLIGEENEELRCLDLLHECDPRAAAELGLT